MDLVRFVIAREHMHHEVHAKAVGELSLAFAGKAPADRQHGPAVAIDSPGPGPVVAAVGASSPSRSSMTGMVTSEAGDVDKPKGEDALS